MLCCTGQNLFIFVCFDFLGVLSALKNLQDRLKQVEREKNEAEQHLSKLATRAASSAQAAGNTSTAFSTYILSFVVAWFVCLQVF